MKYNRLQAIYIPLAIFILFELFIFKPNAVYACLLLANALLIYAIYAFVKIGSERLRWWNYWLLPVVLVNSSALYSLVLIGKWWLHILAVVIALLLNFYLRNTYQYLADPEKKNLETVQNISAYTNFLAVFFLSAGIFGLQAFLNSPIWLLMLALLPCIALIFYQIIWINQIDFSAGALYVVIGCLLLMEIAWSLTFLPYSYNALGLIFAICYYIIIGLTRFYLKDQLRARLIKMYVIFGLAGIFLILLTS